MMNRSLLLFCALFLLALPAFGQAETTTVSFDFDQELNEISPYVYGSNHGPWSEVSLQMQEEALVAGITFLRWPGGRWGDLNNITNMQIDLFMRQAEMWNIEPNIHVRLEGNSPEAVAEIVRYANIEKGYNIRYWTIGNEPTLFDGYDPERFATEWREFALAMEAVDPNIIFLGPEVHQYADSYEPSYLDDMRNWLRVFLEINGDIVDIVSVHRYPFPLQMNGPVTTIAQMRGNVPNWATLVEILRADIREVLGRDLPIAITEVNSHWSNGGGGDTTPDSYYNAIWWSGVLTTLINSEVDIVAYWNFFSAGSNGAFGMLDRYNPRPSYYTYQLYKDFGTIRLFSESSDEYITALAARRDDGAVTVIITNLYEEEKAVSLDFGEAAVSVSEMRVLAPELLAETVDSTAYFDGATLTMPAQSVTRIVFTVDS